MVADLHDVVVRKFAVEVRVQRPGAIPTIDHRTPPRVLATTPLLPLPVSDGPSRWTLLPDVKPAAWAWSHNARCSCRRPRKRRLMTVPLATPVASAIS